MRSPLLHFSEPEARQLLAERARAREVEYLAGQIGEATLLRSLMLYGMPLDEARGALARLQQEDNGI